VAIEWYEITENPPSDERAIGGNSATRGTIRQAGVACGIIKLSWQLPAVTDPRCTQWNQTRRRFTKPRLNCRKTSGLRL
jgi:hypothetical protein